MLPPFTSYEQEVTESLVEQAFVLKLFVIRPKG